MAVAVEGTPLRVGDSTGSSITQSYTLTAANLLIVGVTVGDDVANGSVGATVPSWNGVAMTLVPSSIGTDSNFCGAAIFYKENPDLGTHDVTWPAALNQKALHIIAFTGYVSLGTASTNGGIASNPAVTASSDSGDIVVGFLSSDAQGTVSVNGGTGIGTVLTLGSDTDHSGQYKTASGSSTAMNWNSGSDGYGASAVAIKGSGGGGGAYNAVPVLEYHQSLRRGGVFH